MSAVAATVAANASRRHAIESYDASTAQPQLVSMHEPGSVVVVVVAPGAVVDVVVVAGGSDVDVVDATVVLVVVDAGPAVVEVVVVAPGAVVDVVVVGASVVVDVVVATVVLVVVEDVVVVVVGRSVTGVHGENSEVFPRSSVAVAVTCSIDASTRRDSGTANAA